MGKPLASLLLPLLLLVSVACFGQRHTVITHPHAEMEDGLLHISYDIINSGPEDRFYVTVLITDTYGKEVHARSLSGDVGTNISGGKQKEIIWDLKSDQVILEDAVEVVILLEATSPLDSRDSDQEMELSDLWGSEALKGEDGGANRELLEGAATSSEVKTFSRTGLVFQSLLFPGWGLTRLDKGPHWIKGLAAYACVAGSVYLNGQAVDTYAQIGKQQDYQDKEDLFQQALRQDNISEVLAITAAGIWVVDFIWTLVGSSDLKKRHKKSADTGLSLITDIDPLTYAPMVGIHIRF